MLDVTNNLREKIKNIERERIEQNDVIRYLQNMIRVSTSDSIKTLDSKSRKFTKLSNSSVFSNNKNSTIDN